MKKCGDCKQELSIEKFNVKKRNKQGGLVYQSKCKECNRKYQKEHYNNNKDDYQKKARIWERKYKKEAYGILISKSHDGCRYCGETDFRCLEFNHLDISKKANNISTMVSNKMSINEIEEELKKCEVVCSNCHKKITAEQFGWYAVLK